MTAPETPSNPGYALAYVGKANVYATYSSQYFVPSEAMPKAKLELQEALRLDDRLPEAHHSMARIHQWFDWDRKNAEEEFQKALELQPNSTETLISYFGFLSQEKRFDECFAQLKRAQQLDPLSVHILYNFGYLFTLMGEYDRAIEQFQRALALSPNYDPALRGLCAAYREAGRYGEAIASIRRAVDLNDFDNYLAELGYTYAVAGQRGEALNQLSVLLERSRRRYVSPVRIARVYAGLGMKIETYQWLGKAYQDHSDHILNLAVDPMFAGLRGEPRFEALLRKIGVGR